MAFETAEQGESIFKLELDEDVISLNTESEDLNSPQVEGNTESEDKYEDDWTVLLGQQQQLIAASKQK